jgi:hypothetical protein
MCNIYVLFEIVSCEKRNKIPSGDIRGVFSVCVALIHDNGKVCKLVILGSFLMQNVGCADHLVVVKCSGGVACAKAVRDYGSVVYVKLLRLETFVVFIIVSNSSSSSGS